MISIFELFKIGIGPSSSHTVGPMHAAGLFVKELKLSDRLTRTNEITINLYGSLALTGKGHGTDKAILLGLEGNKPDSIIPDEIDSIINHIRENECIRLSPHKSIQFIEKKHLNFLQQESLQYHPNGLIFTALDAHGREILQKTYYSVGGGFVVSDEDAARDQIDHNKIKFPFQFSSAAELQKICRKESLSIYEIVMKNETISATMDEVFQHTLKIWDVMQDCVKRGFRQEGILPGGLNVKRRAPRLYREYTGSPEKGLQDPLSVIDWINLYALAVNEENAAGGRVVTAPTNGAAGIIPSVMHYYARFVPAANDDGIVRFLLTAGAIGILYKLNASISGAEVGCQGEVGVACSMAAAGLVAALNGSNEQIEQAAEIGMEHNLGLTCDPVQGLVQIPCIERNAMASVKAINAARMAMQSDGSHKVSLDQVIETMRQTGEDMKSHYKETSQGGLAVNVIEC
ncbi:MAG: L-serine ammonia-lyase [Calditrichaeota bacterium]|nr:MAG: L-serine ammonia-lyase [Calditrichota bacterium]